MEEITVYVVQRWISEPYSYWANCSRPTSGMFDLPNPYFETEEAGREFLDELRAASGGLGKLRLIRQVTTTEEI